MHFMHGVRTIAALCMLALLVACSRSRGAAQPRVRACASNTVLVLGACVAREVAQAVCGPSSIPLAGGCVPRPPCKGGEARDAGGTCIAAARVRSLAQENGIVIGEDDDVGCEGEQELVLRYPGNDLACAARPEPLRACPLGSVGDERACIRVKNGEVVDAALWLRTVVGPSGGRGSPAICRALQGLELELEYVEVVLRFADNDVSQLELRARPAEAERLFSPFSTAARSLGGASQTFEVATRVRCGRPITRPITRERAHEK